MTSFPSANPIESQGTMTSSDLKEPLNPNTGPDVAASDPEAPSNPETQPEDNDSDLTDLLAAVIKLQLPRMDENYNLIQPGQAAPEAPAGETAGNAAAPEAPAGETAGNAAAGDAGAEKTDGKASQSENEIPQEAQSSNNGNLTESPANGDYYVGERVQIREIDSGLEWDYGKVTRVRPLNVDDRWANPYHYEVRHIEAPNQLKEGDQIVTKQALFPNDARKYISAKTKGVVTHVDSFGTVEIDFGGRNHRCIIKEDLWKLSKLVEANDVAKAKAPTGDVETGDTGAKGKDDAAKDDNDDGENLKCLAGIVEQCLPKEYAEKLKAMMASDDDDKDQPKDKPMGAKDHAVKATAMAAKAMADMKDPEKRAATAKKYQADLITNGIYLVVPMIIGWLAAPLTGVMNMLGFIPPELYHITAGTPLNGEAFNGTAIALAQVSSNMTSQAAIQYAVATGLKQYWIIFMGALSTIGLMIKNMQTIADHLFEVLDSMQTHVDKAFDTCRSELPDGVQTQVKCPNGASRITSILDNSVNAVQKDFKIQPTMPWLLQRKANLMAVVALPIIVWQLATALSNSRNVNLLDETVIESAMMPQGVGVNATNGTIGMIELASATLNLSVNSTPFDIDHAWSEIQSVGIWSWFIANLMMAWEQLKTLVTNAVMGAFASGPSLVTIVNIAIGTVEAVGTVAMVEAVADAVPKKELLDVLGSVKDGTSANLTPDGKAAGAGSQDGGWCVLSCTHGDGDSSCTVS